MSNELVQQKIARLYVERNRRYERMPERRLILNLGTGSGSFARNYPHAHVLVVNVDRGDEVAGYPAYGARAKGFRGFATLAGDRRCVNVRADVLEALPLLPSRVFDLVVAGQLVEHFSPRDLELLLHEAHRVLVSGGLLQVDTVTEALGEDTDGHEQHFTAESLGQLLENMTFRSVELETFAEGTAVWALFQKEPEHG